MRYAKNIKNRSGRRIRNTRRNVKKENAKYYRKLLAVALSEENEKLTMKRRKSLNIIQKELVNWVAIYYREGLE